MCSFERCIQSINKNIKEYYTKTGQFLFWIDNYKLVKETSTYKKMGSRFQAIIKVSDSNFRTFITTKQSKHNKWQIADHYIKCALPSYKKK